MNFRKIYCIAAMALMCCTGSMFTSCDDYLDVDSYFDEIFELDSVFKRKEYLEEYINGAGKLLPNEGDLWTNAWSPYQGASDENFTSWNDSRHKAIQLMVDEVTMVLGIKVFVKPTSSWKESMNVRILLRAICVTLWDVVIS